MFAQRVVDKLGGVIGDFYDVSSPKIIYYYLKLLLQRFAKLVHKLQF